jgi:protein-disulfide isomerase
VDSTAVLKNWAAKMLPRCTGGTITMERIPEPVPAPFAVYGVTLRSTDEYCGAKKYLLYSPKSQQVLLGTIVPLPVDTRPPHIRVAEETSKLLNTKIAATVAPFPLQDGLRAVTLTKQTSYGPFGYHGYLDASGNFLIVGPRGNLASDASKSLLDAVGASNAVRRGKKDAKVEILELSDFQCPTCGKAHEKVEPIIRANLDKISYGRIDLPLFEHHEWALVAAAGGRAIQRVAPGKYWEYVDYVFKNQELIGKLKFDDVIKNWVEDHDVDWKTIEPVYRSQTERNAILEQVSRAFDVGINSTPTFIINGQIMGFGPEGTFTIESIKSAIASVTPAKKAASKPAAAPGKKK